MDARTYLFVRLWPLASTFEGGRQGPSETPVRIHLAEKIFAASYVQIAQINHLPAVWRPPLTVDARGEQSHSEELLALHLLNGVQLFISHLTTWPRTRRFSEPAFRPSGATNHWKNTAFRDFPTISRTWTFFLLRLSLF